MGPTAAVSADPGSPTGRLLRRVAEDGTAAHPHAAALACPGAARRDLTDAAHALCAVHGSHPGAADEARRTLALPWLDEAAAFFAGERALLAQLVAAAGPLPSTPGQAATESALAGQRHALRVLVGSDRLGCSLGVVVALLLDWRAVRPVLGRACTAFGLAVPVAAPPAVGAALAAAAVAGASDRALLFGAEQLLAQHRGLWSLLEARAAARDA